MAMPVPVRPELLRQYGIAVGVEGAVMTLYEWGINELKKQKYMFGIIKTLKNWTDSVLAVAISMVTYLFLSERLPEIGVRIVRVLGSWGVKETLLTGIRFRPAVVVTDAKTIEAFNLDANSPVEVYVDKSKIDVTASTDGAGYVKITLPESLPAGTHKVMVHTKYKSAYIEQYVE